MSSPRGVDLPCHMHRIADLGDILVIFASLRTAAKAELVLPPLGVVATV